MQKNKLLLLLMHLPLFVSEIHNQTYRRQAQRKQLNRPQIQRPSNIVVYPSAINPYIYLRFDRIPLCFPLR